MLQLLALAASANAACVDLGANCAVNGWYGICTSNYNENWGANEVDGSGVALTGKKFGNVCPATCAGFSADAQGGKLKSCEEWMSPDLNYDISTVAPQNRPTFTLQNGQTVYAECAPKAELADSLMSAQSVQCVKTEVIYDEGKCNQFQQYCDWIYTGFPTSQEYKRIPERKLFAETAGCTGDCPQVDPSRYSAHFGLFPPGKKDFFWHALDRSGEPLPVRESKWVMWHYDVLTDPLFTLTDCDCLDSEKVEGPDGWFTNSACDEMCTRDMIGSEEKLYKVITVHDRVCHREVDVDGIRWDPSPNMNYLMPLDKIFPTRLGKGQDCPGDDCQLGLNMQRGEGGASWYWWGKTKNSWNENDQSSPTGPGELVFETEHECKQYASAYWDVRGMDTEFHSVCDRFSSKTSCVDAEGNVIVTNSKCSAACDASNTDHDDWFVAEGLINTDGSAREGLTSWFHDNCVYTPYQPENDHAWPNFYVPEINQCFSQWQIGFEDQGCDACMHPLYDNTTAFNDGWSYKPLDGSDVDPSSEGYGNCTAQCGKIIMERAGEPKDVKSAQECQEYCQNDPNCAMFQWRPIPDWAKSAESAWAANKFNQVRSCLLKNRAQVEGSLRARWGADGEWIWHPEKDQHAFANQFQNLDCAQGTTGDAWNWCLGCEDTDGQVTYHSWKWRNNMISGPKFCDEVKISHGNTDRLDSPYFDSAKTPMKIDKCPAYDMGVENPVASTATNMVNLDGSEAPQYCVAKDSLANLSGGAEWAEHCVAANRMYDTTSAKNACEKFQQYCDWVFDFKLPASDYKRADEASLGIKPETVAQNTMSSTFGTNPPCQDICTADEAAALNPATAGVCTPPETCDSQPTTVGGYKNNLPSRDGGWVFWHHEELGVIHRLGCDCLEDPTCSDQCSRIANDADIYTVHFLPDRVCHRENDINSTRWDPSPNMQTLTGVYESEWGALGMVDGESGSSWYWYGGSKPSWNNWDQTSHVGKGEKVFATEYECRAYATSYWTNMGYPAFDSVCTQFSSITPGISNAMCEAACDGTNNTFSVVTNTNAVTFLKEHCIYTPYQAENDFAWPNVFVPDSNECFGQWQIGYEDQGCDGCLHSQYDNSASFNYGWSYAPTPESGIEADLTGEEGVGTGVWEKGHCSAQCGKIITEEPGKFKDVKTAQECQQYCQEDENCVHWQWRSTPDYMGAASVDDTGYVNENNRVNKVRSCLLKNIDQVMGALEARWDESATFVDGSSPDWDQESNWEAGAPYNEFSSGFYQINDSQNSQTGEGNNWYLECNDSSDFPNTAGKKTTHSWKWRNNIVSGPKYCGAEGTGRIYHGATIPSGSPFLNGKATLSTCPTRTQFEFGVTSTVSQPDYPGAYSAWPVLDGVASPEAPATPELFQPWKEPSTTDPGTFDKREPCDISTYYFCSNSAWEDACLKSYTGQNLEVAGCAVHCAERVQHKVAGKDHIMTAEEWQTGFAKYDEKFSVDHCVYSGFPYIFLGTTSTTTTTTPVPKTCQYSTTTTSTTTTQYVPWEPSCPSGAFETVSASGCTNAPDPANNWSGYVPVISPSRDGSFISYPSTGTVEVITPRPYPTWCKDTTVTPLAAGKYDAHQFYENVGRMKLACVGWTETKHAESQAASRANPLCQEDAATAFSFKSMAMATGYFPDFLGYDNLKQNQLDLASFFAHTGAETTGGNLSSLGGYAWCYSHEQTREPNSYGNQENLATKCPACVTYGYTDKINLSEVDSSNSLDYGYYGRGALQLTYGYNYGAFQLWAEKNLSFTAADVDFLTHPGLIATEDFGFASSVWFFMSPERSSSKPSMHDVVSGWIVNGEVVTFDNISYDQLGRNRDLGYQMNILNGGLECGGKTHNGPTKRVSYFGYFTDKIGFEGDLEAITSICKGCTMAPPIANTTTFKFWYEPTTSYVNGGDTLNTCSAGSTGSVSGGSSTNSGNGSTTTVTTTADPNVTTLPPICPPFRPECKP